MVGRIAGGQSRSGVIMRSYTVPLCLGHQQLNQVLAATHLCQPMLRPMLRAVFRAVMQAVELVGFLLSKAISMAMRGCEHRCNWRPRR